MWKNNVEYVSAFFGWAVILGYVDICKQSAIVMHQMSHSKQQRKDYIPN